MAKHVYRDKFYDYIDRGAARSAARVIPIMQGLLEIGSVLDVGCGRAAWLAAWHAHGVKDIIGIDGEYIERDKLPISPECFLAQDLSQRFDAGRRFDVVQCLEVGEHLPAESADDLVEGLVRHSDVVMFSAASPGQGGENHINEQPLSYWVSKFEKSNYDVVDVVRPKLRGDHTVEPWYRNNIVVFARAGHSLLQNTDTPCWRAFRAPVGWRVRNAVLANLPTSAVTAIARFKHMLSRNLYS